jgi:hypothetical protein
MEMSKGNQGIPILIQKNVIFSTKTVNKRTEQRGERFGGEGVGG